MPKAAETLGPERGYSGNAKIRLLQETSLATNDSTPTTELQWLREDGARLDRNDRNVSKRIDQAQERILNKAEYLVS